MTPADSQHEASGIGVRSAQETRTDRLTWLIVGGILAAHFALCILWGLRVPLYDAPDEPGHYDYVLYLANRHALPEYRPDRQEVHWEGHQPPLYYAMAAVVLAPTGVLRRSNHELDAFRQQSWRFWEAMADPTAPIDPRRPWPFAPTLHDLPALRLLRILSAVLSTATVLGVFLLARAIFQRGTLAMWACGVTAFIPQVTFMGGVVNSDSLSNLISVYGLLVMVTAIRRGQLGAGRAVGAGLLAGLGITTKLLTGFLAPSFLLTLALVVGPRRRAIMLTCLFFAAMVAVASWYLVPHWHTQAQVIAVSTGTEAAEGGGSSLAVTGSLLSLRNLVYFLGWLPLAFFTSFWGRFGWMSVTLPTYVYAVYAGATTAAAAGVVARPHGNSADPADRRGQQRCLWLCAAAVGLVMGAIALFNLQWRGPQGRYLFAALGPVAILLCWGWAGLFSPSRGTRKLTVLLSAASTVLGALGGAALLFRQTVTHLAATRLESWYAGGPHRYPLGHYLAQLADSYSQALAILFGCALGVAAAAMLVSRRSGDNGRSPIARATGSDTRLVPLVAGCAAMAAANVAILLAVIPVTAG
jgi:hypothetical protein